MKKFKSVAFGTAVVTGTVLAAIAVKVVPVAIAIIVVAAVISYWHYKGGTC